MRSRLLRWAGLLGVGALLALAGSEWLHWQASRRYLGDGPAPPPGRGSEAVIVLGYPARRNGQTNPIQRWRCQIAARAADLSRPGRMVFTGAASRGRPAEAEVMSGYARDALGIPADRIAQETKALSTWQNVAFTLPFAQAADTITYVSDPLHAARARRYLRAQRPDLADRLRAADDYRFGDHPALKVATAAYELFRVLAVRRPGARPARPDQE
jgi:uncharacterized SAM-binding protein YcdF (DUF218 family)